MATGKYHKHNYLKFLIFRELYEIYPKSMTYNEIAEIIEVEKSKVASMLKSYRYYGYVGRRKGREAKTNRLMYKYKLNILGIQTYMNLRALHNQGRELNLRKLQRGKPLQKIDSYIGETRPISELKD
jgi:AAA+ ATPase superfamily predicted ATPase